VSEPNGRAFNEWLRAQLKAKKMSQRQLAQQSGVDHSTISRLIRGDRMPSLGTATKLARGLRELRDEGDAAGTLGVLSVTPQNPTARVEYALRADDQLSEPQVRQVMEYYLAVRLRRFGRAYQPLHSAGNGGGTTGTNTARAGGSGAAGASGTAPMRTQGPMPAPTVSRYRSLGPASLISGRPVDPAGSASTAPTTPRPPSGPAPRPMGRYGAPQRPNRLPDR
jgi:transcriptional regulator with XRE-family HTH domain